MSEKKHKKPRRRSRLYAGIHFLLKWPVRWLCRLRRTGLENEPAADQGGYLVICNHLTWADPIYLCATLEHAQPHFMAKRELFKIPLLNVLIRALGAYPVNRGGADVGAIKHTISMLENGLVVGMFPQGHRQNGKDPRMTKVKSGAALVALKAGVPVLPVFIKVKDNRTRFLCRKEIIVGKPITVEDMKFAPDEAGEYQRIVEYLFEQVCALGDQ